MFLKSIISSSAIFLCFGILQSPDSALAQLSTPDQISSQTQDQSLLKLSPKQKRFQYNPPKNLGAPKYTRGGLVRGNCIDDSTCLIALMPGTRIDLDHFPLTLAAYPTFFFNMPESEGFASLILDRIDDDNPNLANRVYKRNFSIKLNNPSIMRVSLPEDAPPLEVNKNYSWSLRVSYENGSSEEVNGFVRRVALTRKLGDKLKQVQRSEYPSVYAKAGLWFETLEALDKLQCTKLDRQQAEAEWTELLNSVNLNSIAKLPIAQCKNRFR